MSDDAGILPKEDGKTVIDYREVGATGLRRFSGFIYDEFMTDLTGWKGIAIYKEMMFNDATVTASLRAIETLCRKVKWWAEPAGQSPEDEEAAEFLESCMNDMSQTWIDTVVEVMTFLGYGHSLHEIVYKRRCGDSTEPAMRSKYVDGRIGWRKLPIRSQDTLYRWQFDDNGGIQGVEQLAPPHYYHVTIPVEKFLLFRTTVEKNNPLGHSVLRGAYRAWYMKKNIENIEAIGIERDLAGLPIMGVPSELLSVNASPQQKALLESLRNIVVNIRRNSQEGMLMPLSYDASGKPQYELKLLSTGGNRQFNTSDIINRWDQRIAMTMLADFLFIGQAGGAGSFSLVNSRADLFSNSLGSILDIIADVFNRYAVPRLFALNDFDISDYPKIKHGDVGAVNLQELGQYITQLAGAGAPLFPNVELEKYLMEVANLPASHLNVESAGATQMPVDTGSSKGKEQEEIPDNGKEGPTAPGHIDTSPVNAPKNAPSGKATTNVTGAEGMSAKSPKPYV